jgi:hypothetical protein
MPEIKINNEIINFSFPKINSLKEIIDLLLKEKIKPNEVISQVIIDGEMIDFENGEELKKKLDDLSEINFTINNSLSLAFHALYDCGLYIDSAIERILEIVQLYRENEVQKANNSFPEIIDAIDFFVNLITKIYKTIFNNLSTEIYHHELFQNLEIHLLTILKSLLPAKEKGDITMLCDLLEYELAENLKQWKTEIIPSLEMLNIKD